MKLVLAPGLELALPLVPALELGNCSLECSSPSCYDPWTRPSNRELNHQRRVGSISNRFGNRRPCRSRLRFHHVSFCFRVENAGDPLTLDVPSQRPRGNDWVIFKGRRVVEVGVGAAAGGEVGEEVGTGFGAFSGMQ
eukprot:scaffold9809_cov107-Cylindrotheca_fusiformis.AAC.1